MAFVWKFGAGLSKLHSTLPMELFEKKFDLNFFSFSDTLRRYFGVLPTKRQCRQKCNLRIQRNIWRVVFEKNVFSSFSDIGEFTSIFCQQFFLRFPKVQFSYTGDHLREITFFGKSLFSVHFRTMREQFLVF